MIENREYLIHLSVIEVDEFSMQTPELQSQLDLESKIGNSKMSIFDLSKPNEIYYKPFGDDMLEEENALPCGDELVDVKVTEIDKP